MPVAKKRFGQHFLHDPGILRRITAATQAAAGETLLEIGPGPGGLTAELVRTGSRVVAIEKDRDLVPSLRARWPEAHIIEGDALELDWHQIVGPGPFRIVGNIPYNITTPLIEKALTPPRPRVVVFLVQRELADRVAAHAGSGTYGALSVGVQVVASVERLFTVPAGAFKPRPKVDSAVLRMTPLAEPLIDDRERVPFRQFVVGLFSFRRKQLGRGLRELTGAAPAAASAWLGEAGIDETARPETLEPRRFLRLFRVVHRDRAPP
jgi:16S rRNA (adenine1518-N6/adenine1519-N6)-dimethyltransferase